MNYKSLATKIIPEAALEPIKRFKYDLQGYFDLVSYVKGKSFETPPHIIKALRVIQTAKTHDIRILVETGTYLGEMVRKTVNHFEKIFTIELDQNLANKAIQRFKSYPNVQILRGDSGILLGSILEEIREPVVFWLDGHYSGGVLQREIWIPLSYAN